MQTRKGLTVVVDGQPMMPRRVLTAAPSARHAHDSELLGGVPAPEYALDDDLYQPGVLNDPSNPLEWTKLKNVPSGFADGVDDAGLGDGHSLDASDGDPVDVVHVNTVGTTRLGMGTQSPDFGTTVRVAGVRSQIALEIDGDSYATSTPAVFVRADSTTAILANANTPPGWMSYATTPTSVVGISLGEGN